MTRWLWNNAEAGATHLGQRRPIAQCLIHRVNTDIICLCTRPRRNKATHMKDYSWHYSDKHTHSDLSDTLDWRPQTCSHPEITNVQYCDKSDSVSVTNPGQQELLWPRPVYQWLTWESWSSSWKLLSDRGAETARREKEDKWQRGELIFCR